MPAVDGSPGAPEARRLAMNQLAANLAAHVSRLKAARSSCPATTTRVGRATARDRC